MDGINTPPSPLASPTEGARFPAQKVPPSPVCAQGGLELLEIRGDWASVGTASVGDAEPVAAADDADDASYTTVMLQNIPNKFTRTMLINQLHVAGFGSDVDYLYVPTDFKNRCNMGYCFLNFRTDAARRSFMEAFHGVAVQACLPGFNSNKVCHVARAKLQGREENLRRLRASADLMAQLVYNPDWLPLLFDEAGNEVPFPREDGQPYPTAAGVPPPRRRSCWTMRYGGSHNNVRHQQHQQQQYQQQQQQQQQGWRGGAMFPPGARVPPGDFQGRRQNPAQQQQQVLGLTMYPGPMTGLDAGYHASIARGGDIPMMIGLPIIQKGFYTACDPTMAGVQCSLVPVMVPCSPTAP